MTGPYIFLGRGDRMGLANMLRYDAIGVAEDAVKVAVVSREAFVGWVDVEAMEKLTDLL